MAKTTWWVPPVLASLYDETPKLLERGPMGALLHGPSGSGKTFWLRTLRDAVIKEKPEAHVYSVTHADDDATLFKVLNQLVHGEEEGIAVVTMDDIHRLCPYQPTNKEEKMRIASVRCFLDAVHEEVSSMNVLVLAATPSLAQVSPRILASPLLGNQYGLQNPDTVVKEEIGRQLLCDSDGRIDPLCEVPQFRQASGVADVYKTASDFLIGSDTSSNNTKKTDGDKDIHSNLHGCKQEVQQLWDAFVGSLENRDVYNSLGLSPPKGALIFGSSGVGKTSLAAQFLAQIEQRGVGTTIRARAVDLISKYVGVTEANIASLFRKARRQSPCVIFLDNIDRIAPPRVTEDRENTSSPLWDRILSIFLTEIDGITSKYDDHFSEYVFVVGCSQSMEYVDPALRRSGRLDLHIKLGPLEEDETNHFIAYLLSGIPLFCSICDRNYCFGESEADDGLFHACCEHLRQSLDNLVEKCRGQTRASVVERVSHIKQAALRQAVAESDDAKTRTGHLGIKDVHLLV